MADIRIVPYGDSFNMTKTNNYNEIADKTITKTKTKINLKLKKHWYIISMCSGRITQLFSYLRRRPWGMVDPVQSYLSRSWPPCEYGRSRSNALREYVGSTKKLAALGPRLLGFGSAAGPQKHTPYPYGLPRGIILRQTLWADVGYPKICERWKFAAQE